MSTQPPSGGFSLFPNTTTGPPRRQTPRGSREEARSPSPSHGPHAISTEGHYAAETSVARPGREAPQGQHQHRVASPVSHQENENGQNGRQSAMGSRGDGAGPSSPVVQQPRQAGDVPPRTDTETAFSQAQTLVRGGSTRSRSSIAKRPFPEEASGSGSGEPVAGLRSIFPRYNPDVPLNQQEYFPTQTSPTHIPMAAISRPLYSPEPATPRSPPPATRQNPAAAAQHNHAHPQWPPQRAQPTEPPVTPPTSTTDELRSLWKVANGWKASASEGQVFTLKLAQEKDTPTYTLSSTSQPFYNMRIDPTSAAANITLSRHDPSKSYRPPPSTTALSSASSILSGRVGNGSSAKSDKNWLEVLSTALEPAPRHHRPSNGLVASLRPAAATKMLLDRPNDEAVSMMAEREFARLVWDDDSASHYLVHPALATPFCVTIERMVSWSRVEYTLEHHESPNHLAKLTRDGTGGGYLEVDTGLASKIESFYIVDIAVCALMIVASQDKHVQPIETFEPPPPPQAHLGNHRSERFSLSSLSSKHGRESSGGKDKRSKKKSKRKMEEFEIQDVESQDYSFGKPDVAKMRSKLPWPARGCVWVIAGVGKVIIWCVTIFLKMVLGILMGVGKCLGLTSTYGDK